MSLTIGIDIGSSSIKLTLIDENHNILNQYQQSYPAQAVSTGRRKEVDPEVWFRASTDSIKMLLEGFDGANVHRIGFTGQMHTTVFVDKYGHSIRPAIMWNDARTDDLVLHLKNLYQQYPETSRYVNILSTGNPCANLFWLKQNEPKHFASLHKFLIGHNYLVARFTGIYATDYSSASTSAMFDWDNHVWSEKLQQLLGFPAEIFPSIIGSAEIVGTILPSLASELGISADAQIIAGTGDNPASAIASGCFENSTPVLSLGTSGVLMFPKAYADFSAKGKNVLFSANGREFSVLTQGTVQSCGSSIDWWFGDILELEDYDVKTRSAKGCELLFFFPHLIGEKTIYQDSSIRGAFFGLTTNTTRADLCHTVLEGLSLAVRQLFDELRIKDSACGNRLLATGGGSCNSEWLQLLADVLNITMIKLPQQISAAYGVAILASERFNSVRDISGFGLETCSCVRYTPCKDSTVLYNKKYLQYLRIYDAMKTIFNFPV